MPKETRSKIEFVEDDKHNEVFHVFYKHKDLKFFWGFAQWSASQRFKTLKEAEEKALSFEGQAVEYLGVHVNGVKKGVMAWQDQQPVVKVIEEFLPPKDTKSFALLYFSENEVSWLKASTKNAMQVSDSLDKHLLEKIQNIKLKNKEWTKVEFTLEEVNFLKDFLNKEKEPKLSEKLVDIEWIHSPKKQGGL